MKDKIKEILVDVYQIDGRLEDETAERILRLFSVMPSLPDGLDDNSNCDHNFKLGWIACWEKLKGNEA